MMSSAGQGLLLTELRLSQGSRQFFPERIAEGRQLIYGDAIALTHEPDDRLSQQFIERWFTFNQCLILPALCLQAALTVGCEVRTNVQELRAALAPEGAY